MGTIVCLQMIIILLRMSKDLEVEEGLEPSLLPEVVVSELEDETLRIA